MGGGDLNLKKSWHPNTMRNMEKVWKAEQRDNEERRRIAELQQEINAERSREDMQRFAESAGVVEKKDTMKLDWMYKGPSGIVDREEYLLGRPIDKTFEQLEQSEQQGKALSSRKNAVERGDECLPNSIRFASDQQVDLARKMMEDPLLVIKKKEVESRQQLLSNPVKLKQLKQLVEMQSKKKKQKKEKKGKKDKKKKKKKKSSKAKDTGSDSNDDRKLDALLAKKLNSLKDAGLLKGFTDDNVLEHKSKKHRKDRGHKDSDSDSDCRDTKKSFFRHKHCDSSSDHKNIKNFSSKHKHSRSEGRDSDSDYRHAKNSLSSHKQSLSQNHDSDSVHRDRKTSSDRYQRSKSKDTGTDSDSDHRGAKHSYKRNSVQQRENVKRKRSVSPWKQNDKRKNSKGEDAESRRNSNKSMDAPDGNEKHRSGYRFDKQSNHKYRNVDSNEVKQRHVKCEKDRSPGRPSKITSPDNRRKHEVDRDKAGRARMSNRGEIERKIRKRQDSGSSLELDSRGRKSPIDVEKTRNRRDSGSSLDLDNNRHKTQKLEKIKKPSKQRDSSSSEDSDSSSDSNSKDHSPRTRLIRMKRQRGSDSEERSIPKFGLMLPDGSKPVPKPVVKVDDKQKREEPEKPKWVKQERRKLDEKEKEARRKEMMENSNWREKEREYNKRRHELNLEEERRQQARKFDDDFARKQFALAVSHSTVEGRIKSNIGNIQRSKMAMDSNFARR